MKPYNDPDITSHEFLLNVMHDAALDLPTRMKAAKELIRLGLGNIAHVQTITIRIEGGMPDFSVSCVNENDCRTRTTPCPWQRYMGHLCHEILQVKGHA
jgi:hypothetical protein